MLHNLILLIMNLTKIKACQLTKGDEIVMSNLNDTVVQITHVQGILSVIGVKDGYYFNRNQDLIIKRRGKS